MARRKRKGMLPDEYMQTSLIEVWPDNKLDPETVPFLGREQNVRTPWEENRPQLYIAVVRRVGLQWHHEVMIGQPIEDGIIPAEVFERMVDMRNRIMAEQRSQRGKDNAAARREEREDEDLERIVDQTGC